MSERDLQRIGKRQLATDTFLSDATKFPQRIVAQFVERTLFLSQWPPGETCLPDVAAWNDLLHFA